jgi:L-ascorbate metabolism protein UlaG (beta-lactamase superfamily)
VRTLRTLDPQVIIPTHYDDVFRPLAGPMALSFNVRFDRFVAEVARVSRTLSLRTLDPLVPLTGC